MAVATKDSKKFTNKRRQGTRRVEFTFRVKFADYSLAAAQDLEVGILPRGYVHERLDPVIRTPEGEAATFHVGIEADDDYFAVSVNANAGSNVSTGIGAPACVAGTFLNADTPVRIKCPAAAATLNVAVVTVTFVGYMANET